MRASVRPFVCSSARRKSLRKTTNRQNDETTKRTVARALMPPSVRPFVCSSARRKSLRKTTNRQNDETTKRTVARALMPPSVRLLIRPSTRRKGLCSSVNSARAFALQQFFPATLNYFTIFLLYLPMNIHSCRWGVRTTRVRATTTATRARGVTQWLLTVNTLFLK